MAAKPLSALGPSISALGDAAARANFESTADATRQLRVIVETHGKSYHIKGRGGRKVPLGASADVRDFSTAGGRTVFTGKVIGVPQGFWSIVEHGRSGGYIITRSKKGSFAAKLKKFEAGELGSGLKPLRTPYGPRQFVIGGPAGPLGRPWAAAMAQARKPVPDTIGGGVFTRMRSVWK